MATANPEVQLCIPQRDSFERHRTFLEDHIDSDFGLLEKLRQSDALSRRDVLDIEAKDTSYKRSSLLLAVISNKNKFDCLIAALRDTNQSHIVNYLIGNGERRKEFAEEWPLTTRETSVLDFKQELIDNLDMSELCLRLYQSGVINRRQRDFIDHKPTPYEKAKAFLDILRRCSLSGYRQTIQCLIATKQKPVAKFLDHKGVIVGAVVNMEVEAGNCNEIEKKAVEKIANVLDDVPPEGRNRVLNELLTLGFFQAKQSHSIALYFLCVSLDQLDRLLEVAKSGKLKEIMETVFSRLVKSKFRIRLNLSSFSESCSRARNLLEGTLQTNLDASIYSSLQEDPRTGTEASAVQVVNAEKDHTFTLNEAALEKILLDPRIRDRKVVVLSVVGASRKGKSFLLDFFIRYLHDSGSENWMGDPNAPFQRFPWKWGPERYTTGILMWSEPLPVKLPSGETAFVLLMDTQGAYDSQSTVRDCATIFAMSAMLSSMMVYNLSSNIQENDLQHLQYFTDYGRLALQNSKTTPFQDLYFLVRDWKYPYQHQYGWEGGGQLLRSRLEIKTGQFEEDKSIRREIRSCFGKIECCLLPHPGKAVATNSKFDGRLSDIYEDFKVHVRQFVSRLFSGDCLSFKKINGTEVTGKELLQYFKAYIRIFRGNKLPHPRSIFQATVEANNLAAVAKAEEFYTRRMEEIAGRDKPYVDPKILKRVHDWYLQESVTVFNSTPKMGGEEKSRINPEKLKENLQALYNKYDSDNTVKNPRVKWKRAAIAIGASVGAAAAFAVAPPLAIGLGVVAVTAAVGLFFEK